MSLTNTESYPLSVLIKRDRSRWSSRCPQQRFNVSYRFRFQKHISTHRTNLCRDVINDNHPTAVAHCVYNLPLLVFTRTTLNIVFHLRHKVISANFLHVCQVRTDLAKRSKHAVFCCASIISFLLHPLNVSIMIQYLISLPNVFDNLIIPVVTFIEALQKYFFEFFT